VKVLIIGGTGLISKAMTRAFVDRGDEVTLFNRGKEEVTVPVIAAWERLGARMRDEAAAFE
jgi:uncharacterized protein YbjT (DUF2867 family)